MQSVTMNFSKGVLDLSSLVEPIDFSIFQGRWEDKRWPNTPGTFYGGDTDSCGTGPIQAPNNSGLDEYDFEYVFKQPSNPRELGQVVEAAKVNVFSGYGSDGDSKWTLSQIREWWSRRQELLQLGSKSKYLSEKYASSTDDVERISMENAKYRLS